MKKFSYLLCLLFAASVIFSSCRNDDDNPIDQPPGIGSPTATTDPGVMIGGIRWATRNVNAPGTFATNPEDFGMYYQWNRRQGWVILNNIRNWDNTDATGTMWYA